MRNQSSILNWLPIPFFVFMAGADMASGQELPPGNAPRASVSLGPPQNPVGSSPSGRRLTVADMIGFATVGDPWSLTWNDVYARPYARSPDGRQIAVVVRRGRVDRGVYESDLTIISNVGPGQVPTHRTVVTFATARNYQPIAFVRWLDDSRSIIFGGTDGNQPSHVYRIDTETRALSQISRNLTDLLWFDATPSGDRVVTIQARSAEDRRRAGCEAAGCLVSDTQLSRNVGADESINSGRNPLSDTSIYIYDGQSPGGRRIEVSSDEAVGVTGCFDSLIGFLGGISPDGRYALQVCQVSRWPAWWSRYSAVPIFQRYISQGDPTLSYELMILDLRTGQFKPVTGTPYTFMNTGRDVTWIDGGRSLLLTAALERLDRLAPSEQQAAAGQFAVLEYEASSGAVHRVTRLPATAIGPDAVRWRERGNSLTVAQAGSAISFRRAASGRWLRTSAYPAEDGSAPNIHLTQGLNERPVLVADFPGAQRVTLLDPNPGMDQIALGKVEAVSWRDPQGIVWHGGLYLPPDYVAGRHYPLVIQTHGFDPNVFSLTGLANNFAAQPLAARGMAVLQVNERTAETPNIAGTPEELIAVRRGYEAAIDYLAGRGIVDRNRVGLMGWSATGLYVGYFLTHSSYHISANVFTPTGDFGWWWWLMHGTPQFVDAAFGAAPFGSGLGNWLEMSPSFNLNRVEAPVLIWGNGPMGMWDWYAGLRRLDKPVEMWELPGLEHDAYRVSHRALANNLTVDWFDFWLNRHEDPDPAKAPQYARWHRLRELQGRAEGQRPPLLQWTSQPADENSPRPH